MQRDKLRQGKKADERSTSRASFGGGSNREQREDLSLPVFRSPALESASRQKSQVNRAPFGGSANEAVRSPRRSANTARGSKMSHAAEDRLGHPGISRTSRKSLPYLRSRLSNAGLPANQADAIPKGHTVNRVPTDGDKSPFIASKSRGPIYHALSEEEQKKLA